MEKAIDSVLEANKNTEKVKLKTINYLTLYGISHIIAALIKR